MIYFDNSATTLVKPTAVAEAVHYAINNFGNPGRSFYDSAMRAALEIFTARELIAKLVNASDPLDVAFTSSATESINLVVDGLISRHDTVVTTIAEHNSILRPLYNKNCKIKFIDCNDKGVHRLDGLEEIITPDVKAVFFTHASNVTGNITDIKRVKEVAQRQGVITVMDASQTIGCVQVDANMADIICFTGHKSLFGPQGTGGVIMQKDCGVKIAKTGGSGSNSFDKTQSKSMPDLFEAGTLNSHGIYGLQKGLEYILNEGIDEIHQKNLNLIYRLYEQIKNLRKVIIYGDYDSYNRLGVLSFNIEGINSDELSYCLWDRYKIATRPGVHCAPLMHKKLGTDQSGAVRISLSYFNTTGEIDTAANALKDMVR